MLNNKQIMFRFRKWMKLHSLGDPILKIQVLERNNFFKSATTTCGCIRLGWPVLENVLFNTLWALGYEARCIHCFSQSIKTYQTNEPISHPILLYTHFQVLFTKHTSKSHKPHVYSIFQLLFQTHLWVFLDFQVKIAPKSN